MFRLVKNNKGVSMVEVVIALAVIGLVTAAALTIMIGSVETTLNTLEDAEAQNFVFNAVECYIAAENDLNGISHNFIQNMTTAEYTPINAGSPEYVTYELAGGYKGEVIVTAQSLYVCVRDEQGNMFIDWQTYAKGAR